MKSTIHPTRPHRGLFKYLLILVILFVSFVMHVPKTLGVTPNTYEVDNIGDAPDETPGDGNCMISGGDCTLRAAIEEANATAGPDIIIFQDPGMIITPGSSLPALSDESGGTTIQGDHTMLWDMFGTNTNAIVIYSDNNKIHDLTITGFWIGVWIKDGANNNYIGTDGNGIDDTTEGNLISTNEVQGVLVEGDYNTVAGNFIGVNENGSSSSPNKTGISVQGNFNVIGTNGDGVADSDEGNLISGNTQHGIVLNGDQNIVAGNIIGLNSTGTAAIPNGFSGVYIHLATENIIGTNGDGSQDELETNTISGNTQHGILLSNSNSNIIAGNRIGTDPIGTSDIGNQESGIKIGYGHHNLVGTNSDGISDILERNLISGSYGGIILTGSSNYSNTISGNHIGTNESGLGEIPNKGYGIEISAGAHSNIIGTSGDKNRDAGEGNLISGNNLAGILLTGSDTQNNVVAGNWIGVDVNGDNTLPNQRGIEIKYGAHDNLIGTDGDGLADSDERNIISGNDTFGIALFGGTPTPYNITIAGNYIGSNASGTVAIPNESSGIYIESSDNNVIGYNYDDQGENVEGNLIMGNQEHGIYLWNAAQNDITRNIISANALDGVFLVGGDAIDNRIRYNSIYDNGGLGIDLYPNGVNANDAYDTDTGPNTLQNYPVLNVAVIQGSTTMITGIMQAHLGAYHYFIVDFYTSENCDTSGFGEGKNYLGWTTVEVGPSGSSEFIASFIYSEPNQYITAVAGTSSNQSEFSACIQVTDETYSVYMPLLIR